MEEKKYLSIEEKKALRKAREKQKKLEEKEEQKRLKASQRPPHVKGTRRKKFVVFLLVVITLFCISFTTTAYIIMNANQLTIYRGDMKKMEQRIQELELLLKQKEEEIEILTFENASSLAPSFAE